MGLPPKQERFCQAYVTYYQAARAARAVGYSARSAAQIGCNLLRRGDVQTRIEELEKELTAATRIRQHLMLEELAALALTSVDDFEFVPADQPNAGEVRPKADAPPHAMRAVKKIKREQWINSRGSLVTRTELELHEKHSAIVTAMKHLGMLKERIEHSIPEISFAEQLKLARERVRAGRADIPTE